MNRILNIISAVAALSAFTFYNAGEMSAQNDDGTALGIMGRNLNPVTLGMGGADATYTGSPAWSLFSNPAAITFSEKMLDMGAGYSLWQPDGIKANAYSAGVSFRFGKKFGVSAGFTGEKDKAYKIFDENGESAGSFKPSYTMGGLSFSYKFVPFMSVGVNVKSAFEKLTADDKYSALGVDAFIMGKVKDIYISAGVRNIGEKVKGADKTSWNLPATATAGVSYDKIFGEKHGIFVAVDDDIFFKGGNVTSFGAAYTYNKLLTVRAGYNYATEDAPAASFASVGIGLSVKKFYIDAAYLLAGSGSPMKNTLSAALGITF